MDALGELFQVLRQLGFEKQPTVPIARVPEKRATIYVDVKSAWGKASLDGGLILVFGICHGYPRAITTVAGAYIARPGPTFDGWLARAKATPLELMAERRADGSGVLIWRESPTRASVFARIQQLNDSRALVNPAPPAYAGPPPQAPPPSPWRVIEGAPDSAHAWAALVRAGLVPPAWTNAPHRRFHGYARTPCPQCGGTGVGYGYGETSCYGGCSGGQILTDRWDPIPQTPAECASYAADARGVERFEVLAFDLFARTAMWHRDVYNRDGTYTKLAPTVAIWSMFGGARKPCLPKPLEPVWAALEAVVPDVPMPKRSVVEPMIGWSQPGARAWATARARGLRVPALPQYGIPDPLVGHAFAELPDPFVAAAEMESLPYDFFGLAPSSLDLWAWHRAPS